MWLSRHMTDATYGVLAREFKRDRSSVCQAVDKADALMRSDVARQAEMLALGRAVREAAAMGHDVPGQGWLPLGRAA
jgi:hypothetical protein